MHRCARVLQHLPRMLQPIGATGAQRQPRAGTGERGGDGQTDAAAAAGNQHPLAVQGKGHDGARLWKDW